MMEAESETILKAQESAVIVFNGKPKKFYHLCVNQLNINH